jgi:ATP-dependent DNA ligase
MDSGPTLRRQRRHPLPVPCRAMVFRHACKMGLEGILSKRLALPYRSGPSRDWIKVKNPDSGNAPGAGGDVVPAALSWAQNAGQGLSQRLLLPVRTGVGADDPAPRALHPRRERRHRGTVAFAKAQPGRVDYAFVPGTVGHITTELFAHTAAIKITRGRHRSA